jgi:acetyltransferase-like isoleucine patch superfamily enzyme
MVPLLGIFLLARTTYFFIARVFFCEPFFKAYCTAYGRNLHTGVFLHWIQGRGELIVGDNVLIDGKCSISFAARYSARPGLIIGDNTGIGHGCSFTIGKQIRIGKHCRIAGNVMFLEAPGHPSDPVERRAGLPAPDNEVRPIIVEDNVWIGGRAIIMPGVTIGRDSIVASGSVIMSDVPPNTLVAGNPARQVRSLAKTA